MHHLSDSYIFLPKSSDLFLMGNLFLFPPTFIKILRGKLTFSRLLKYSVVSGVIEIELDKNFSELLVKPDVLIIFVFQNFVRILKEVLRIVKRTS